MFANYLVVMKSAFLIVTIILLAHTANACRCAIVSLTDEVAGADQIFVGTVFNKRTSDKVYYHFTVSKMFKGAAVDTVVIQTGFGGGDCGMNFEMGKSYLVYARRGQTTRCCRNALANNNPDLHKLKYLLDSTFSASVGKTNSSLLTASEAEYFNAELMVQRKAFDFNKKQIALVQNGTVITKQQYFNLWGGAHISNQLLVLTDQEKVLSGGYDDVIVLWRKQGADAA